MILSQQASQECCQEGGDILSLSTTQQLAISQTPKKSGKTPKSNKQLDNKSTL